MTTAGLRKPSLNEEVIPRSSHRDAIYLQLQEDFFQMIFHLLHYRAKKEQQIACALPVPRGAAAVPSSAGGGQQAAALVGLDPALSSPPGGPR